jgi:hypothetical protein
MKEISKLVIVNEEGLVLDDFTLDGCAEILSAFGYTIIKECDVEHFVKSLLEEVL